MKNSSRSFVSAKFLTNLTFREILKYIFWTFYIKIRSTALKFSYKINSPYFTAKLWIFFSSKIISRTEGNKPGTGIIFSSPGGDLDILEAFHGKPSHLDFYWLDSEVVHHLFKNFFGTTFEDYEYNSRIKQRSMEMLNYELYLANLLDNLKDICALEVLINFNFVASSQRKFMEVSSKKSIKFICIFKECFRTPSLMRMTEIAYRQNIEKIDPFVIYVHNKEIKQMIVASGITSEDKVIVTGQSRSSFFYRMRLKPLAQSEDKTFIILFFAIKSTASLSYFGPAGEMNNAVELENKGFNFSDTAKRIEKSLINIVKSNNKLKLNIKGKIQTDYDLSFEQNSRIKTTIGGPDMNLIQSADLIVGLNTTGLVEGLLAGKEVISCEFGKNINNFSSNCTFNYFDVIKVAHDEKELEDFINLALKKTRIKLDSPYKKFLIDRYLGNSDGGAAKRLYYQIFNLK